MLSKKIVKYIQSLSHKKLRDQENAFIAEGPKIVEEFLISKKFKCKFLCADAGWLSANPKLTGAISQDDIYEINETELEQISLLKTPNKVLAIFEKNILSEPLISGKLSLMLDDIQDPGNLGTIIRIADWFNIENIFCSEYCVDCYNPKVVQSAMGSIARVNIFYTPLLPFINKNNFISVYAASLEGMSILNIPKTEEAIILIGNESKGISKELMQVASQKITIPGYGHAESLNAAVAAGIILSHLKQ